MNYIKRIKATEIFHRATSSNHFYKNVVRAGSDHMLLN